MPFCLNTSSSLLSGNIACTVNGSFADVRAFNTLAANSFIEIKVPFTNPVYNAAITSRNWRIKSYFKASGGYYYLNGDSGAFPHVNPKCNVVSASSSGPSSSAYWPQMYHKHNITRTAETSPIHFSLQFTSSFSTNAGNYVTVTIPNSFTLALAEFVAMWDDIYFARTVSQATSGGNLVFTVYFHKDTLTISTGQKYELTLTTLNAQNNANGFRYPTTQGTYNAKVQLYDSSNALLSSSDMPIYVFKTDFTRFESRALTISKGFKNILFISFLSTNSVAAGSTLNIKVPVVSYDYMGLKDLFDEGGGSRCQL